MDLRQKFQHIEEIVLNNKIQRKFFEEETFLISEKKAEIRENNDEILVILNSFNDLAHVFGKTKLRAYPKTPDSLNAITANAKWQRAS